MVNLADIMPAKHQHASIITVSMLGWCCEHLAQSVTILGCSQQQISSNLWLKWTCHILEWATSFVSYIWWKQFLRCFVPIENGFLGSSSSSTFWSLNNKLADLHYFVSSFSFYLSSSLLCDGSYCVAPIKSTVVKCTLYISHASPLQ